MCHFPCNAADRRYKRLFSYRLSFVSTYSQFSKWHRSLNMKLPAQSNVRVFFSFCLPDYVANRATMWQDQNITSNVTNGHKSKLLLSYLLTSHLNVSGAQHLLLPHYHHLEQGIQPPVELLSGWQTLLRLYWACTEWMCVTAWLWVGLSWKREHHTQWNFTDNKSLQKYMQSKSAFLSVCKDTALLATPLFLPWLKCQLIYKLVETHHFLASTVFWISPSWPLHSR